MRVLGVDPGLTRCGWGVVDGLPDEARVGLRVYGAEVFERTDPGACTDSQLVVPIGTDNRPELRDAGLEKALAMLLFGMMNWMFTWLQPKGPLSHADMAPVVADLFFGGLAAVNAPRVPLSPSNHSNGDTACPSSEPPSSRSASPRRPRSRAPTSTSA